MQIKVKKTNNKAQLPTKGTTGAGAYDLYAHSISEEQDGLVVKVDVGLAFEVPEGYMLCLVPRSSLSKYGWVLSNSFGVVDSDFRGSVSFKFRCVPNKINVGKMSRRPNLNREEFPYKIGDRIGQCFLLPCIDMEFKSVRSLNETDRGTGGYGHTGK